MQRLKENKAEARPTSYELFVGDVKIQDLLTTANAPTMLMHAVTFTDGARSKWHTHGSEQVLVVTSGTGVAANRDEEWTITTGDADRPPMVVPNSSRPGGRLIPEAQPGFDLFGSRVTHHETGAGHIDYAQWERIPPHGDTAHGAPNA